MSTDRASLKIQHMHKKAAEKALLETHGNRTEAAEILGVSVRTVRNWIKKFGLAAQFPHQRGRQK